MLLEHSHLLYGDKALEVVPRLRGVVWQDDRPGTLPAKTVGPFEKVLHEGRLAGQLKLDSTITKTIMSASGHVLAVSLDGGNGGLCAHELDIRIIRLATNALHDDVHRLLGIIQNLGVASKEGNDLSACHGERNL